MGRRLDLGIAVLGVATLLVFSTRIVDLSSNGLETRPVIIVRIGKRSRILECVSGSCCIVLLFVSTELVSFSFFSFPLRNCAVRTGHFNGCFGGQFRLNGKLGTSLAEEDTCLELCMLPLYAAPLAVTGTTTTK